MNQLRKRFEDWHRAYYANPIKQDSEGGYHNAFINARWEAWQASRIEVLNSIGSACAEVEIPDSKCESLLLELESKSSAECESLISEFPRMRI